MRALLAGSSATSCRAGLDTHARATTNFERLGSTRALVRTARALLGAPELAGRPERVKVERQLVVLHRQLRQSLCDQLLGPLDQQLADDDALTSTELWREQYRVTDLARARELHALVDEWLDASVGDVRRASWVRGWAAVPVLGEVADDEGIETRLRAALREAGAATIVQVKLRPPPRYVVDGQLLTVGDGVRLAYEFSAQAGVRAAVGGRAGAMPVHGAGRAVRGDRAGRPRGDCRPGRAGRDDLWAVVDGGAG